MDSLSKERFSFELQSSDVSGAANVITDAGLATGNTTEGLSTKPWYVLGWSEIVAVSLLFGYYLLMVVFGTIGYLWARNRIERRKRLGRPMVPVSTAFPEETGFRIKYTDDDNSM